MDETSWLIVLVAGGLVAGMLVRRWWLLTVVAVGWLAFGAIALVARPEDRSPEPSNEVLAIVMAALLAAAMLATALGITLGRAIQSANRRRPTDRRRRSSASHR